VGIDGIRNLRRVVMALTVLLVSACTSAPDVPQPRAFDDHVPDARLVLIAGFAGIHDKYIDDVSLRDLATESIRGLAAIDPALTIDRSNGQLILKRHGDKIASADLPESEDPTEWGDMAVKLTREASVYSRDLRQASTEAIYQAMFDGALAELDVYSRYAGAEEADRNRQSRDGFGGIGIRFRMNNGVPVITEVVDDGPAAREGLAVGDAILLVDGEPVADLRVREVTNLLRGAIRSVVELNIRKPTGTEEIHVVVREHIIPPTVNARVDDGLLLIRIRSFNQGTADAVAESLKAYRDREDIHGIVLDLRGNPGGLLRQSIEVADAFLDHGRILDTRGRHPDSVQHYAAAGVDSADGKPVVVLIDGRSASAAEIVAAALQDSVRAVVIGTSSYGKGTVQTVLRLPNDGEMTLTWSRFVAPSGYAIHGLGVFPVLCLADFDSDARQSVINALSEQPQVAENLNIWRHTGLNDMQQRRDLRANCPPKRRVSFDEDLEVARLLIDDAALYQRALEVTMLADQANPAIAHARKDEAVDQQ